MLKFTLLIFLSLFINTSTNAQYNTNVNYDKKHTIGLLVPLYLDSIYKGNNYRYGKKFPRFTLQGLEFIQGANIAMDSFPLEGHLVETFVYDTKSTKSKIDSLIFYHRLDSLDLLIGAVKDEEVNSLAEFAKDHRIPFVSVTYPNDAGIKNNPYYIIVNPTLKTHCESIFSLLLQNHSNDHIVLVRKSGSQEDRVEDYFKNINYQDSIPLLHINTVLMDSNSNLIEKYLDSTKKNIIIGGSLDEDFAQNLVSALKKDTVKYHSILIGMPNWGGFNSFGKNIKNGLRDFPFYYTTYYFNEKNDSISKAIQYAYMKKYKGYPGDFAYKGFEIMYAFSRLIKENSDDYFNNIMKEHSGTFSHFKFLSSGNESPIDEPDYYENKHLFFIKKINGKTSKSDF